ncbi:MAG: hypothetical protein GY942_26845, partial [Aestuariibacter sp.]|nr:hypothetical protein [Aestuariibacter sp.]
DTLASIKVTTLETAGSLQLSGVDVTLNQVISKANIDAGNLKFVPVANANGSSYDSFAFSVNDGTTDSASSYTLTVDVTAVNDAPSIDTEGEMVLTNVTEDDSDPSGDTVAAIIASDGGDRITDPDTGAVEGIAVINVDDDNGQWQYSTDAGSNWTAFGSLSDESSTLLNSDALIRFVPNANYTGSAGNIEFRAWDQT